MNSHKKKQNIKFYKDNYLVEVIDETFLTIYNMKKDYMLAQKEFTSKIEQIYIDGESLFVVFKETKYEDDQVILKLDEMDHNQKIALLLEDHKFEEA